MKKLNKKGQVMDSLGKLAVGVAALAIVLVITFLIIAEGQSQLVSIEGVDITNASTFTAGYNATVTLQAAVATIPPWVPIVIITAIGAILIGLVALFRKNT